MTPEEHYSLITSHAATELASGSTDQEIADVLNAATVETVVDSATNKTTLALLLDKMDPVEYEATMTGLEAVAASSKLVAGALLALQTGLQISNPKTQAQLDALVGAHPDLTQARITALKEFGIKVRPVVETPLDAADVAAARAWNTTNQKQAAAANAANAAFAAGGDWAAVLAAYTAAGEGA